MRRLASLAAAVLLVAGVAVPAVAQRGRAGGGGRPAPMARPAAPMARPAAPMARPAAPMARPAAPMARPAPQMPMSRPAPQMQQMQRPQVQMPMNRPAPQMPMQRPAPQIQRPQVQTPMQRPNLPNMQRPGFAGGMTMNRPSLPSASGRPFPSVQPSPSLNVPRPGIGSMRPTTLPGMAQRPAGLPGGTGGVGRPGLPTGGLNRPVGLPGNLGGGATGLPGSGIAGRPMPSLRPGAPGQGGATTLPGTAGRPGLSRPGDRPSLGGLTKPAFPAPGTGGPGGMGGLTKPAFPLPGPGGTGGGLGGGGLAGGNRPGLGGNGGTGVGTNRPVPLPGQLGGGPGNRPGGIGSGGNRPGLGGNGNRPGIGGDGNRPVTLPGDLGGIGNRPGSGGNRPGIGGDRPWGRPDRPGIGGNRPGIGGDRPWDRPDRPGISGNRPWNRPGIGNGGTFIGGGNSINNINTNINNNNIGVVGGGGGWGYPGGFHGGYGGYGGWGGYGYGGYGAGWADNWNTGFVNPHYGGWYSGCWNGNWGGGYGGWWAPVAFGAATWGALSTIGNWGLGYGALGYGGGYVNPYYSSIPATVVASSPYDYSRPVVVNNYVTADADPTATAAAPGAAAPAPAPAAANESNAAVDAALAKFKAGDYAGALAGFDRAVKLSPNDSVIHEVRALTLFALGRYPEAAATLNAVLVSAPGMDWTTISNVYGSVDAYTAHLRKLEEYCRTNPDSAAGHFVLAYHYLVGGHADIAADALRVVVAKQPGDLVAKRLLEAITPPPEEQPAEAKPEAAPPAAAPATPPAPAGGAAAPAEAGPETDLVGTWKATSGQDGVELAITEDSRFTWKATPAGRPAVEISGEITTGRDTISLDSEKQGSMVASVKSKGPDAFDFALVGAPKEAKPLEFRRTKEPGNQPKN